MVVIEIFIERVLQATYVAQPLRIVGLRGTRHVDIAEYCDHGNDHHRDRNRHYAPVHQPTSVRWSGNLHKADGMATPSAGRRWPTCRTPDRPGAPARLAERALRVLRPHRGLQ